MQTKKPIVGSWTGHHSALAAVAGRTNAATVAETAARRAMRLVT